MGGPDPLSEYTAGHLPGAVLVDLDADLAAPASAAGRHPLPEGFAATARRLGVEQDVPVVVYDDWQGRAAARAWWLLEHHGHRDVRVLDGGWAAWLAAGGPVETGPGAPVPPGDFESVDPGTQGRNRTVTAEQVLGVDVLVDARAPERYRGDVEPVDPVAGHVPGAVNVPTTENLNPDGTFRTAGELAGRYAAVGAVAGADVAVYCGSGVTAAHDLLALRRAGVPAALYPGSWSEWVADPTRPVEQG